MALRDLKKSFKKEKISKKRKYFRRHLVIGDDIFSLAIYDLLRGKFGAKEVRLLSEKKLNLEEIKFKGPSSIRGNENLSFFQNYYPDLNDISIDDQAVFFKDMQFKKFNGRNRSETLLWGEDYYVSRRLNLDELNLLPFFKKENFFEMLEEDMIVSKIKSISPCESSDKKKNAKWEIRCFSDHHYTCEHLYWGKSPFSFYQLYQEKSDLSERFVQFCQQTVSPQSLYLKMVFDHKVTDRLETLFIPLSYTHEWGHFIGEFQPYDEKLKKQEVEFLTFVDPDSSTEEDVAKKIKILKRNLQKIFPEIKKNKWKESLVMRDGTACLNIDDDLFCRDELEEISFFGVNAPLLNKEKLALEKSYKLSHFMRGFISYQNISEKVILSCSGI